MNLRQQIQRYVYERIERENISLRELAESVGIKRQVFWYSLQKTKKGMTLASLEKLAEAFNLQPWEFLREVSYYEKTTTQKNQKKAKENS